MQNLMLYPYYLFKKVAYNSLLTNFILICFIFLPEILYPQIGISFKYYTQKDGLSSNIVKCIYKDSKGFVWIGTVDGLNRFDGNSFTVYKNDPFDTSTISNNEITSIMEDGDSNLWIGTNEGLNLYDWKKDNFSSFLHHPGNKKSISYNWIRVLFLDSRRDFWIGTKKGLNHLKHENGDFKFNRFYPSKIDSTTKESPSILSIIEDNMGDMWIGTWGAGLCYFNREKGTFQYFTSNPSDPYAIKNNMVEELGILENGMILTATTEGICLFDPLKRRFYDKNTLPEFDDLLEIKAPVYSIGKGKSHTIWIGTARGLFAYNQAKNKIVYNGELNQDVHGSVKYAVDQARSAYIDNTGILWTGIAKAGLGKYDPNENKFFNHRVTIKSSGKHRDYITGIKYLTKNDIWLGTSDDGLLKIDSTGKVISRFIAGSKKSNLSSNMIRTMCFDKEGKLWIGTSKGIDIIDPNKETINRKIEYNPGIKNSLIDSEIMYLYPDEEGKMWIISSKGIQLYDYRNHLFVKNPLPGMDLIIISKIYRDNEGVYWITGQNKMASYCPINNEIHYYTSKDKRDKHYISNNEVLSLFQDSKGLMWFGTKSGLNIYDKTKGHLKTYKKRDGISGEVIHGIIEDNHGNIWFSTFNGITKYNRKNDYFINYYPEDGLTQVFHGLSNTRDGKIAIMDEKQFYIFDPRAIEENKIIPPVYFTSININGQEITAGEESFLNGSAITASRVNLKNQHEIIKIKAAILNYSLPEKNQYAYKLFGYDTSWHFLNTSNEITLMNLKPGNYKLQVIGSNNDNNWNREGAILNINMKPPWYKSTWAFMIYVLIISSLLMFLRWYYQTRERIKRQVETARLNAEKKYELEKLESQKEHELNQAKLRFFYDISHEIRTPLTLISGPLKKLSDDDVFPTKREDLDIIIRNADRLKDLINQLLDIRKLEKGEMQVIYDTINLKNLIKSTIASFQKLFEEKKIYFHNILILDDKKYFFDKDKTQKIISNLLSNAIKFTPANKRVTLKATILSSMDELKNTVDLKNYKPVLYHDTREIKKLFYLEVTDEGIGIQEREIFKVFNRFYQVKVPKQQPKSPGTGIGLALIKDLVEKLAGDIFIKSEVNKGTSIIIYIPLVSEKDDVINHQNQLKKVALETKNPFITTRKQLVLNPGNTAKKNDIDKEEEIRMPMVLIVEDNHDLLKYMANILSGKYMVKTALNGEEGIEKAHKYIPDLIISDIMMPVMGGYDFCLKVKQDQKLYDIPIIVLTAKDGNENIKAFMQIGVDDYIVKPFHNDLLESRIENLIHKRIVLKKVYKQKIDFVDQKNLPNRDDEFLQEAIAIVEENLANHELDKNDFAMKMNVSKSQLYKKLHHLTGLSPNEFVRNVRLKKAAYILSKGTNLQIAEIGFMVGFADPNYFSRKFKEFYGMTPSKYSLQHANKEIL